MSLSTASIWSLCHYVLIDVERQKWVSLQQIPPPLQIEAFQSLVKAAIMFVITSTNLSHGAGLYLCTTESATPPERYPDMILSVRFWGFVFDLMCAESVWAAFTQVCAFLNHAEWTAFVASELQSTSRGTVMVNGMHLRSAGRVILKGM